MSVIEFTIPLRCVVPSSDDFDDDAASDATTDDDPLTINNNECAICMHHACTTRECSRSPTKTSCCSQTLCCGCLVKLMRRCKCTATCRESVGICPFCRDTMRTETTLQVFMSTIPVCPKCQRRSTPLTTPTPTPTV